MGRAMTDLRSGKRPLSTDSDDSDSDSESMTCPEIVLSGVRKKRLAKTGSKKPRRAKPTERCEEVNENRKVGGDVNALQEEPRLRHVDFFPESLVKGLRNRFSNRKAFEDKAHRIRVRERFENMVRFDPTDEKPVDFGTDGRRGTDGRQELVFRFGVGSGIDPQARAQATPPPPPPPPSEECSSTAEVACVPPGKPLFGVTLGLLTERLLRDMAVMKVTHYDLYERSSTRPKRGGLLDHRMGVSLGDRECETCGLRDDCWMHLGMIELTEPFYDPDRVKSTVKILNAFCIYCRERLFEMPDEQSILHLRTQVLLDHAKAGSRPHTKRCPQCPYPRPVFKKGDGASIYVSLERIKHNDRKRALFAPCLPHELARSTENSGVFSGVPIPDAGIASTTPVSGRDRATKKGAKKPTSGTRKTSKGAKNRMEDEEDDEDEEDEEEEMEDEDERQELDIEKGGLSDEDIMKPDGEEEDEEEEEEEEEDEDVEGEEEEEEEEDEEDREGEENERSETKKETSVTKTPKGRKKVTTTTTTTETLATATVATATVASSSTSSKKRAVKDTTLRPSELPWTPERLLRREEMRKRMLSFFDSGINQDRWTCEEVASVLRSIDPRYYECLGYRGLEPGELDQVLIHVLPVPPNQLRHSSMIDGERVEHVQTNMLRTIVQCNIRLAKAKASKDRSKEETLRQKIQQQINFLLNSKSCSGSASSKYGGGSSGGASKAEEQNGKEGIYRRDLNGCRVGNCARCPIVPDVGLSVNEVVVPQGVASKLTYPETVTDLNRREMVRRVTYSVMLREFETEYWNEERHARGFMDAPERAKGGAFYAWLRRKRDELLRQHPNIEKTPEHRHHWRFAFAKSFRREEAYDFCQGALEVRDPSGKVSYDLKLQSDFRPDRLEVGWIVLRNMRNGDVVMMNRQPTLHRMSINGFFVRIDPNPDNRSFRIHPADLKAFNGDYDGDEMNLHFPQSEEARAEVLGLMIVGGEANTVNPGSGNVLLSYTQDPVIGMWRLTHPDTFLNEYQMRHLVAVSRTRDPLSKSVHELVESVSPSELPEPAILYRSRDPSTGSVEWVKKYTGKQLFRFLLPDRSKGRRLAVAGRHLLGSHPAAEVAKFCKNGFFLERRDRHGADVALMVRRVVEEAFLRREKIGKERLEALRREMEEASRAPPSLEDKDDVVVRGDELLCGLVDGRLLGPRAGSLQSAVHTYYEPLQIVEFLNSLYRVANRFVTVTGNSMGPGNFLLPRRNELYKLFMFRKGVGSVRSILEQHAGKPADVVERLVSEHVQTLGPRMVLQLREDESRDSVTSMIVSGAKGTTKCPERDCVGQKFYRGARLLPKPGRKRIHPYFSEAHGPLNLLQGGFIFHSFFQGMSLVEVISDSMGARKSFVNSAVITAKAGYIYRGLNKPMEGYSTDQRQSVRDTDDSIVQFAFGGDGMAPEHLFKAELGFFELPWEELRRRLRYGDRAPEKPTPEKLRELDEGLDDLDKRALEQEVRLASDLRARYTPKYYSGVWKKTTRVPFQLSTLIQQVRAVRYDETSTSDNPCGFVRPDHPASAAFVWQNAWKCYSYLKKRFPNGLAHVVAHLLERLSVRRCLERQRKDRFTRYQVVLLYAYIVYRCEHARVPPGEAVGTIAAQSVGEFAAQQTLKDYHFAGARTNITQGIPKANETTKSHKVKNPMITFHLEAEATPLDRIESLLERRNLRDLVDDVRLRLFEFKRREDDSGYHLLPKKESSEDEDVGISEVPAVVSRGAGCNVGEMVRCGSVASATSKRKRNDGGESEIAATTTKTSRAVKRKCSGEEVTSKSNAIVKTGKPRGDANTGAKKENPAPKPNKAPSKNRRRSKLQSMPDAGDKEGFSEARERFESIVYDDLFCEGGAETLRDRTKRYTGVSIELTLRSAECYAHGYDVEYLSHAIENFFDPRFAPQHFFCKPSNSKDPVSGKPKTVSKVSLEALKHLLDNAFDLWVARCEGRSKTSSLIYVHLLHKRSVPSKGLDSAAIDNTEKDGETGPDVVVVSSPKGRGKAVVAREAKARERVKEKAAKSLEKKLHDTAEQMVKLLGSSRMFVSEFQSFDRVLEVVPCDDRRREIESRDPEELRKRHRWTRVTVSGGRLEEIMCIRGIDKDTVYTNDYNDVLAYFGKEHARRSRFEEFASAFDLEAVDPRHLLLAIDYMYVLPTPTLFTCASMSSVCPSIFQICSFEASYSNMKEAACGNVIDLLGGPSESHIFGDIVPFGTHSVHFSLKLRAVATPPRRREDRSRGLSSSSSSPMVLESLRKSVPTSSGLCSSSSSPSTNSTASPSVSRHVSLLSRKLDQLLGPSSPCPSRRMESSNTSTTTAISQGLVRSASEGRSSSIRDSTMRPSYSSPSVRSRLLPSPLLPRFPRDVDTSWRTMSGGSHTTSRSTGGRERATGWREDSSRRYPSVSSSSSHRPDASHYRARSGMGYEPTTNPWGGKSTRFNPNAMPLGRPSHSPYTASTSYATHANSVPLSAPVPSYTSSAWPPYETNTPAATTAIAIANIPTSMPSGQVTSSESTQKDNVEFALIRNVLDELSKSGFGFVSQSHEEYDPENGALGIESPTTRP